jgi:hypothetical protein
VERPAPAAMPPAFVAQLACARASTGQSFSIAAMQVGQAGGCTSGDP